MGELGKGLLSVIAAIITVAIVAVIVSKKSDSAGLVQSAGTALSSVIKSAVTPVPPPKAGATIAGAAASPSQPDFLDGLFKFPLW